MRSYVKVFSDPTSTCAERLAVMTAERDNWTARTLWNDKYILRLRQYMWVSATYHLVAHPPAPWSPVLVIGGYVSATDAGHLVHRCRAAISDAVKKQRLPVLRTAQGRVYIRVSDIFDRWPEARANWQREELGNT